MGSSREIAIDDCLLMSEVILEIDAVVKRFGDNEFCAAFR